VQPGEITSQAGWSPEHARDEMRAVVRDLRAAGVRVSLFVDPEEAPIRWAKEMAADRVELYTEPFARAFERGAAAARESFGMYARASELAHALGLGINAGHDLDLENLVLFRTLPHLAEVSIGTRSSAMRSLWGSKQSVRDYIDVLGARSMSTPNSQLPTSKRPGSRLDVGALEVGSYRRRSCVRRVLGPASLGAATGRAVSFRAESGRTVNAILFDADQRPAPAVVLLPMLGRTKDDWQVAAQKLADANITVLAIDSARADASGQIPKSLRAGLMMFAASVSFLAGAARGQAGIHRRGGRIARGDLGAQAGRVRPADSRARTRVSLARISRRPHRDGDAAIRIPVPPC
jgi:hypothetical protein